MDTISALFYITENKVLYLLTNPSEFAFGFKHRGYLGLFKFVAGMGFLTEDMVITSLKFTYFK